ncbi:hypothetical protein [Amycolatopsis sp. lyj-109]|uniref:hypothetical protein n=1 Tax=Amycolatopsis sp. lyj-109 TaxID=2789287 RepID=UPI0039799D27
MRFTVIRDDLPAQAEGESHWFVAEDGQSHPVAVVRRMPGVAEAFTPNLRWEPVPLGRELEAVGREHRTVRDVSPGAGLVLAYHLARRVRQSKQLHEWGGDVWYFGIYDTCEETFDIAGTRLLVATDAGDKWFGKRYAGHGRWEPTRRLDDIWRGLRHEDVLALSPAEAEAIMKRLG